MPPLPLTNETLLRLVRLALRLVEGLLRDPASLNKPSTHPIQDAFKVGNFAGLDVHWGLGFGLIFCVAMYVLVFHTTWGFGLRIVGGNARAARLAGLPTLVLGGELDALITPGLVRAQAAALGTAATVLPGRGHGFPQEDPAAFRALLEGFLDPLPAS